MDKEYKQNFITETDVKNELLCFCDSAEIIFHPDTENTFAAYQIIFAGGFDLWLNARNGCIFNAGRCVNKV